MIKKSMIGLLAFCIAGLASANGDFTCKVDTNGDPIEYAGIPGGALQQNKKPGVFSIDASGNADAFYAAHNPIETRDSTAVLEPGTLSLMGVGLVALGMVRRVRKSVPSTARRSRLDQGSFHLLAARVPRDDEI